MTSRRALVLVEQLREAAEGLIAVIEQIEPDRWTHVRQTGEWSPSKDAEHVADGAAYHQWIVRRTLGQRVPGRPAIERKVPTARGSQREVVELVRCRTEESAQLVQELTDAQLELPPQPPRPRLRTLAQMIDSVLIGHYHAHRRDIESKLRVQP